MDSFPAGRLPQAECLRMGSTPLEGRCPGAVEADILLAAWEWMGFLICLVGMGNFQAKVAQSGECMFPGKPWVTQEGCLKSQHKTCVLGLQRQSRGTGEGEGLAWGGHPPCQWFPPKAAQCMHAGPECGVYLEG